MHEPAPLPPSLSPLSGASKASRRRPRPTPAPLRRQQRLPAQEGHAVCVWGGAREFARGTSGGARERGPRGGWVVRWGAGRRGRDRGRLTSQIIHVAEKQGRGGPGSPTTTGCAQPIVLEHTALTHPLFDCTRPRLVAFRAFCSLVCESSPLFCGHHAPLVCKSSQCGHNCHHEHLLLPFLHIGAGGADRGSIFIA